MPWNVTTSRSPTTSPWKILAPSSYSTCPLYPLCSPRRLQSASVRLFLRVRPVKHRPRPPTQHSSGQAPRRSPRGQRRWSNARPLSDLAPLKQREVSDGNVAPDDRGQPLIGVQDAVILHAAPRADDYPVEIPAQNRPEPYARPLLDDHAPDQGRRRRYEGSGETSGSLPPKGIRCATNHPTHRPTQPAPPTPCPDA